MSTKFAKISIEAYVDPNIPNNGYEKYGFATAPNTELTEYISIDENKRAVTGLDVNALSISYIEDEETREAKISEINEIITRLEKVVGKGKLSADNLDYWSNFVLKVQDQRYLDLKKPADEIIYHAIRAGGFSEVARTYDEARNENKIFKFYLKRDDEEAAVKTQHKKIVAKAKGLLVDLLESDTNKLFLMSKILLSTSNEFKRSTVPDIIYNTFEGFIDGLIAKDNKQETPKQFLDAAKLDKEDLTVQALVNDAVYNRVIIQESSDNYFYNKLTQTRYGKNLKEVINYLKNPINQAELDNVTERVEKKWNN